MTVIVMNVMERISMKINELKEHFNEEVEISGFVENIRDLQWVQFVIIKDNTCKVQITIEKSEEQNKGMVELISNLALVFVMVNYHLIIKIHQQ